MWKAILGCVVLAVMFNLQAAAPDIGEIPENHLGATLDGKDVLLENYQGKVVVISFWASWCAPCLKELPVLNSIQQDVGQDLMQVIAVNHKEDRKRYRRLHKVMSESLTSLVFTHDQRGRIGDAYGVEALPTLYVIDKTGKVAYHKVGFGESSIDSIVDILNVELVK
ncbi:TlpA family protein disulfide reductase [Alishewanella jeotgali]|uniref:Thiol:disulfide interchange protein n=1 Tax=Alishewanella jeotgali KCTC 22429 TaxID=1129374 RepID=H3ZHB4_9ALTE|nr:TlpA disulfide reductase family protein [Alishewanella jeotgali]EHR40022.1 thiol:disulfide interchange protein [Alishewanella jeotgali KCTC 22429]